jgi:hypothetical protein
MSRLANKRQELSKRDPNMADETKTQQPPPLLPGSHSQMSPEPMQAAHFAISASFGEFVIGMGRSRLVFSPDGQANPAVEWFASLSVSPVVAKQLRDVLNVTIEQYEERVGQQIVAPPAPVMKAEK